MKGLSEVVLVPSGGEEIMEKTGCGLTQAIIALLNANYLPHGGGPVPIDETAKAQNTILAGTYLVTLGSLLDEPGRETVVQCGRDFINEGTEALASTG